ncbi:MAG: c(7)-type cytochrome triheme domain-containing protein [Thermoleophilia bacterium]
MNTKFILLSVLLISAAVGFVLYRTPNPTEELTVASGAQYEETAAITDQYKLPADILYTEPVDAVVFSHKTHVIDESNGCNTCHTSLFQMQAKAVQGKPDFNMQGLAAGKYCGSCHTSEYDVAFASDTQCARCHVGVSGLEEAGLLEEDESNVAELEEERS